MQSKILVVLGAAAILSVSSTAMARGAHGMVMVTSPIETSSITSASGEIRSFLAALVGGIGVWGPMTILEVAATPLL